MDKRMNHCQKRVPAATVREAFLPRVSEGSPGPTDQWEWEYSPDVDGEQEVLLRGVRMGLEVIRVVRSVRDIVQEWTESPGSAAALSRMRQLASSSETRAIGCEPTQTEVGRALGMWTLRQQSARSSKTPTTGLRDLLGALRRVPPERRIEQIALQRGDETGLIFFDPITNTSVGTVIARQNERNRQRAKGNFRLAMTPQKSEQAKVVKRLQQTA